MISAMKIIEEIDQTRQNLLAAENALEVALYELEEAKKAIIQSCNYSEKRLENVSIVPSVNGTENVEVLV